MLSLSFSSEVRAGWPFTPAPLDFATKAHDKHATQLRQHPLKPRPQPQQRKRRRKEHQQEGDKTPQQQKNKTKEDYSEMSFDTIQKNARSLNSGDRFDELRKELEGCNWDVILLSETWRPEKTEIGSRNGVTSSWALVAPIKNTESEYC